MDSYRIACCLIITAGIIVAMRKTDMPVDKNLLLKAIILFGALSLIVLGMRNPSLERNHGPKQRPRAVVENDCKTPIKVCSNVHVDMEAPSPIIVVTCSEERSVPSRVYNARPGIAANFIPSRASPSLTANNA